MSVGAIGAEILGGGVESTPPPWYTSLKHPMVLGVKELLLFSLKPKNEIFVLNY